MLAWTRLCIVHRPAGQCGSFEQRAFCGDAAQRLWFRQRSRFTCTFWMWLGESKWASGAAMSSNCPLMTPPRMASDGGDLGRHRQQRYRRLGVCHRPQGRVSGSSTSVRAIPATGLCLFSGDTPVPLFQARTNADGTGDPCPSPRRLSSPSLAWAVSWWVLVLAKSIVTGRLPQDQPESTLLHHLGSRQFLNQSFLVPRAGRTPKRALPTMAAGGPQAGSKRPDRRGDFGRCRCGGLHQLDRSGRWYLTSPVTSGQQSGTGEMVLSTPVVRSGCCSSPRWAEWFSRIDVPERTVWQRSMPSVRPKAWWYMVCFPWGRLWGERERLKILVVRSDGDSRCWQDPCESKGGTGKCLFLPISQRSSAVARDSWFENLLMRKVPDMKLYGHFRQRGFTWIELMITVVIVGILASVAYPSYAEHIAKGRRADARARLRPPQQCGWSVLHRTLQLCSTGQQQRMPTSPVKSRLQKSPLPVRARPCTRLGVVVNGVNTPSRPARETGAAMASDPLW